MACKVLLVLLATLLTSGTERPKEVSTRGRRLCLCSDRVLRLSSLDSEASSFVSCEEKCSTNSNAGVLPNVTRRLRRSSRDVLEEAEKCEFNKVAEGWQVKIETVTFHKSGNSSEWYAQVSWSPFTGSSHPWFGYYILYFTGDHPVGETGNSLDCQIISKNQTSVNITSSEDEERINLNVVALPKSLNSSVEYKNMKLSFYTREKPRYLGVTPAWYQPTEALDTDNGYSNQSAWNQCNDTSCEGPFPAAETRSSSNHTIVYVSVPVGILVILSIFLGLLKYLLFSRKRFRRSSPPEFKYHAFIIYSQEDSHWVNGKLLPFLEERHHLKCCIHYRDFTPGRPFQESMAESVYNSYKIIAVLSSSFLKSNYCSYELNIAKYRLLNKRDDSLIMIRIDKENCRKLPRELRKRSFIDYSNSFERPLWENKLLRFLNVQDDFSNQDANEELIDCNITNNSHVSIISNGNSARNGDNKPNHTTDNDLEMNISTQEETVL